MIVTQDNALAKRLKCLRHQGMSLTDYDRNLLSPTIFETYPEIGYNFRMTDIQAAIGLKQKGIPTRRGGMASHLEPAYKSLGAVLPQTERIAASTLLLPIHPALTHEQQAHILNGISELGV